jgi:hypothetical protein
VVVGDGSSSSGSSSSSNAVGADGLPPGAIVIDDPNSISNAVSNGISNGGSNGGNLPVITVEEQPPAAPGTPGPIVINIDNNGATRVSTGAPGQAPIVINGGDNMGYNRGSNGMGSGMTNPMVIPPGSVINVNGQLVRVGSGSNGGWAAGSNGGLQQQQQQQQQQLLWQQQQQQQQQNTVGDDDLMMSDVQTIPAGSFVDLGNGKIVQVGRKAATPQGPQPAGAGMSTGTRKAGCVGVS